MNRSAIGKLIPIVLIGIVLVVGVAGFILFTRPAPGAIEAPRSPPAAPEIQDEADEAIEREREVDEPVGEVDEPALEVEPRPGREPIVDPEDAVNRISVTLTGMDIRWVMNGVENPRIEVTQDSIVTIEIINEDRVPHQFAIDGLNILAARINPGESFTASFGVTDLGTFQYRCTIHPVVMDGEIVVVPALPVRGGR